MFNYRYSLTKLSLFFSLLAICAISCGLFINSKTEKVQPVQEVKLLSSPVEVPTSIEFAGEKISLENFDVRESLDRELLVNSYFQSQTILYLKKSKRYFQLLEPILKSVWT